MLYMYAHIYIYIYVSLPLSLYIYIYMYMYSIAYFIIMFYSFSPGKEEKHAEQVQFAAYKQFCDDTSVEKARAVTLSLLL